MPTITVKMILREADRFHRTNGEYPSRHSGIAIGTRTWTAIDKFLRRCPPAEYPGASSLAKLLALARGKRHPRMLPLLTESRIMRWAREHRRRTGNWPNQKSGDIPCDTPGENWFRIGAALHQGHRGLSPSSLAQLLRKHGVAHVPETNRPDLTIKQILAWADSFRARHNRWPDHLTDRRIRESSGERWDAINQALSRGYRGLKGGETLNGLLHRHRGRKTRIKCPDITKREIFDLIERHHKETGEWPVRHTGQIRGGHPADTWAKIDAALWHGTRGLPGGSSLAVFREEYFGVTQSEMMTLNNNRRWSREPSAPRSRRKRRGRGRGRSKKSLVLRETHPWVIELRENRQP